MRWLFLLAGLLCLAVGFIHAVMGGIETLNPVMASAVTMEARVSLLAIWHGLSVFYMLSGGAFFWAFWVDHSKSRPMGFLLGLFYLVFAGIQAALSFQWFGDPMVLPQWTLLAPIGLFAVIASL